MGRAAAVRFVAPYQQVMQRLRRDPLRRGQAQGGGDDLRAKPPAGAVSPKGEDLAEQDPGEVVAGAQAGLDERRIADLLGQKTPSMARHYSRSANLADKNRETMATLEEENRRRAESVKPSHKSVKPDRNEDQS